MALVVPASSAHRALTIDEWFSPESIQPSWLTEPTPSVGSAASCPVNGDEPWLSAARSSCLPTSVIRAGRPVEPVSRTNKRKARSGKGSSTG